MPSWSSCFLNSVIVSFVSLVLYGSPTEFVEERHCFSSFPLVSVVFLYVSLVLRGSAVEIELKKYSVSVRLTSFQFFAIYSYGFVLTLVLCDCPAKIVLRKAFVLVRFASFQQFP